MTHKDNLEWGVIPDIHADMVLLETAIARLQDDKVENFAFLGDFIDAGKARSTSDDRAVLNKVKNLINNGSARAVMGNHELNAILFHTFGDDGLPLRDHSAKNCRQHQSFIKQIGVGTAEAAEWVEWFLSLPLWLEMNTFRLVHAYWGAKEIELISERRPDGRLKREDLPEVATQTTAFGKAVQTLVSGPEIALPEGLWFEDSGGNKRYDVRVAWWRTHAKTWRDIGLSVADPEVLPQSACTGMLEETLYPESDPIVFCGHYKMRGDPKLESGNVLCLDYPQDPHCYKYARPQLDRQNLLRLVGSE